MTTMTVRLPQSVHAKVQELAKRDGISINQFLVVAVTEKMSAMLAEAYLADEAAKGSRTAFRAVLNAVPNGELLPTDVIRPKGKGRVRKLKT
jgi:hypothetical protein